MKKWIITALLCLLVGTGLLGMYKNRIPDRREKSEPETVTLKWMLYGEKHKETERVFSLFNEALQKYLPGVFVEFEIVDKDDYKEKWEIKSSIIQRR